MAALSAHDRPTRGHAERVRMFTDLLAEEMRISERDRDLLRWAAMLHDVGKLQVPTTPAQQAWQAHPGRVGRPARHPAHGAEIAGALLPWLGEWGTVIVEHHERYDGTGYPHGLAGREISLGARIVSVADAFDVMTAARAYKRPVSRAAAYRELIRFSGTQFDPVVVRAMVSVGAPRLRRAQGALAWLSDLPLVATASVPAATVARVVGAGALATGAVAGGVEHGRRRRAGCAGTHPGARRHRARGRPGGQRRRPRSGTSAGRSAPRPPALPDSQHRGQTGHAPTVDSAASRTADPSAPSSGTVADTARPRLRLGSPRRGRARRPPRHRPRRSPGPAPGRAWSARCSRTRPAPCTGVGQ